LSRQCFEIEDLGGVIASIHGGRRPEHLDACPRCRALLASYRAFIDPPDVPEGSDVRAARNMQVPGLPKYQESPSKESDLRDTAPRKPRLRFGLPWLRPIWAVGAVALLVLVFRQVGIETHKNEPSHVLRGDSQGTATVVEMLSPVRSTDGGLVLTWRPVPEADAYAVVFYATDLKETGRKRASGEARLVLPPDETPSSASQGPVYWRVIALKAGSEIARSAPRPLVVLEKRTD